VSRSAAAAAFQGEASALLAGPMLHVELELWIFGRKDAGRRAAARNCRLIQNGGIVSVTLSDPQQTAP